MWGQYLWAVVAAISSESASTSSIPEPRNASANWGLTQNWRTQQVTDGRDHSCVTSSTPRRLGNTEYQIVLSFGDRNAITFRTSRPIAPSSKAVLRTGRNAHSMINMQMRREDGKYLVDNRVSRSLFRLVLAELRSSPAATFRLDGTDYPLPMADFTAAVGGMMACSRTLAGGHWGR